MSYAVAGVMLAMAGAKGPGELPGLPGEEPPVSPERLRILIVEDDTIIAWTLEALISEMGHEVVDIAASGERALASAAQFQPDLVMMDINLGRGMNGIEAAEGIRKQQRTHIIFVSAYGDMDMRAKLQAAVPGAPLVTKPVDLTILERTILRVCRPTH